MRTTGGFPLMQAALMLASLASELKAQNNAIFTGGTGDGYARAGMAQAQSTVGVFSGGTGDGYSRTGVVQPFNSIGVFSGGTADGYARSGFSQPFNSTGVFTGGSGDGYASRTGTNVLVSIQGLAFLEGPYNTGTLMMNDNLRSSGLVPLTEPYTALGYPQAGGSGGESTTAGTLAVTGAGAVVDWVRVELRDATTPGTVVAVRHALLIRSGAILDPVTSDDFIQLNVMAGNYYVVVRHRNHLGVMSAAPIALSTTVTEVDFTLPATPTNGTNATKAVSAVQVLWAGDVNRDHVLKYTGANNDRDPILSAIGGVVPTNTVIGQYRVEDVNLDGTVKYTGAANDRDPILLNIGGVVPTNTRAEQVP